MKSPFSRPRITSPEIVNGIRKALKDDAAGNKDCTMTDLDMACDILDDYIEILSRPTISPAVEELLRDYEPRWTTHPMSIWNQLRRAMEAERGNVIGEGKSWDHDAKEWQI